MDELKYLSKSSFRQIQVRAKEGHKLDQFLMGVAFLAGGPVEIDIAESFGWFKKSSENGYASGSFRVGFLLETYDWPDKPDLSSDHYFLLGEEQGSPEAMCALGNRWTFNKLSKQRFWHKFINLSDHSLEADRAYARYSKACDLNYGPAFYFKGLHLLKGWGVRRNISQARSMFDDGAKLDDLDCIYMLANLSSNFEKVEFFLKASDKGHAESQYQLARLILEGKVPGQKEEQAVIWLRRAAMQQHAKAALELAVLYKCGKGTTLNYKEAFIWANRAKHLGCVNEEFIHNVWTLLSEEDKIYFLSPSYNSDLSTFFELSNKLFGKAGFRI